MWQPVSPLVFGQQQSMHALALLYMRVHLRAIGGPRQYKYRVNGEWATSPCEPITGDGSVRPTRGLLQGLQTPMLPACGHQQCSDKAMACLSCSRHALP